MTSAIGWYGPLIDLSSAASHVGGFVQLLVFVHRSTPLQFKLSKGGDVVRTDIQVGDETLPFFSVSLWDKRMAALAVSGEILLLQNVKVTRFGDLVEARTMHCSSLVPLVHPYQCLVSMGVDELIEKCQVGKTAMEKLGKVIKWVQRARIAIHNSRMYGFERRQHSKNWKVLEHGEPPDLFLLSEVLRLGDSCKAIFGASVGEIFLPITWRQLGESDKEKMFISRRIAGTEDDSIAEDFICIGCQLCGSPLDQENGQSSIPLYCPKSSTRLHVVSLIYRPFMLYVWDESDYLPILVKNKAAELLFGNIRAGGVHSCYMQHKHIKIASASVKDLCKEGTPEAVGEQIVGSPSVANKSQGRNKFKYNGNIDFHSIWLILLKVLLQQGKNSPLKFEVTVNASLDSEIGKFEMVSVSMPCIRMDKS